MNDISGNKLKHVSPSLCGLKSLRLLDLSENRITTLPSQLCNVRTLESLVIDVEKITFPPHGMFFVFYAPFECFAPVGRSVVQVISAQYLLTPLHEICKILYEDAPREKMIHIDLMLRSHGQRSRSNFWSWKNVVHSIFFFTLDWKVPKLGTVDASKV